MRILLFLIVILKEIVRFFFKKKGIRRNVEKCIHFVFVLFDGLQYSR